MSFPPPLPDQVEDKFRGDKFRGYDTRLWYHKFRETVLRSIRHDKARPLQYSHSEGDCQGRGEAVYASMRRRPNDSAHAIVLGMPSASGVVGS
jgi:hypothetical protein